MDPFETLAAARAEFRERLTAIGPDQWDLPTDCGEWTVRGLVDHLVMGNVMAANLLAGMSREDTLAALRRPTPDNLLAAFDDSADLQEDAFAEPGALERTCHHPVGDIPGSQLLGFRIGDLALHAWDLARAIGADDTLRPEVRRGHVGGDGPDGAVHRRDGFLRLGAEWLGG